MLTFQEVKKNPQILEFISQTDTLMKAIGFTEHGLRHVNLVAQRAGDLAKDAGLSKTEQQSACIAGFCHDMGNFLGRQQHHYWGALLFHQIFQNNCSPKELAIITQAIVNHDKYTMKLANRVSAVVVLADKSDVHRSRVTTRSLKKIKEDIHDRVNYAVTKSDLQIKPNKKHIVLVLKIDTKFVPIIEYFEIFTERMSYCRQAADYLGYRFHLIINDFKLL